MLLFRIWLRRIPQLLGERDQLLESLIELVGLIGALGAQGKRTFQSANEGHHLIKNLIVRRRGHLCAV